MNRKTIECKLITPMLMHGEDTAIAELRPPSIKGAMRFWWRAIHGNLSLDELKKQESLLFGGASENSALKSIFRIKLIKMPSKKEPKINPLPHKKEGDKGYHTRQGYQANQDFKIEFIGRELDIVYDIFELTSILGGFGQRSRRGFGSVQVQDTINIEYIKNLIQKINASFDYKSDNNYPYIKDIEIGKEYTNMNDLIKTISSTTHYHNGDGMFGSVKNGRYASPIYISVIEDGAKYRPIITTLNATKRMDERRLTEFKGAIL